MTTDVREGMKREVRGVAISDNTVILVQDGEMFIRLSIGDRWHQLSPESARLIAKQLTASARRVERSKDAK